MYNIIQQNIDWNQVEDGAILIKKSFSETIGDKKVTLIALVDKDSNKILILEEHFEDIKE